MCLNMRNYKSKADYFSRLATFNSPKSTWVVFTKED